MKHITTMQIKDQDYWKINMRERERERERWFEPIAFTSYSLPSIQDTDIYILRQDSTTSNIFNYVIVGFG